VTEIDSAIETFIGELRDCAREQPAITAAHISRVEETMIKLRKAAQESPLDFGHWWRDVEAVISDRTLSVKARLTLMGPIGDAIGKAFGREDTIAVSSGGVH
jgi:hypothetical protein